MKRFVRLQDLQAEVKDLRNQVEIQQYELETLQKRQRDLYDDLDRRLRKQERRAGKKILPPISLDVPEEGEIASAPAAPPQTTEPADLNEQEAYEAAFGLLKQSRYGEAIQAFRDFLNAYPESALAGDAQYWVAEAHYVSRDFEKALNGFHKVVNNYPDNQKVPDALLKIGYTYYELGNPDEARQTLNELINSYPGTRFAITAENRLKKEGDQ